MTPQMQNEHVQLLEQTRDEFLEAVSGLSDEAAKQAPAAGGWCVLQCVEHIGLSEARFLSWMENPIAEPAPGQDRAKETVLGSRMSDRSTKREAPDPVQPSGRYATLAEALDRFKAARAKSIEFAQAKGADIYLVASKHPFFGPLNGAEVCVLMANHSRRHAEQVREIRAGL